MTSRIRHIVNYSRQTEAVSLLHDGPWPVQSGRKGKGDTNSGENCDNDVSTGLTIKE